MLLAPFQDDGSCIICVTSKLFVIFIKRIAASRMTDEELKMKNNDVFGKRTEFES